MVWCWVGGGGRVLTVVTPWGGGWGGGGGGARWARWLRGVGVPACGCSCFLLVARALLGVSGGVRAAVACGVGVWLGVGVVLWFGRTGGPGGGWGVVWPAVWGLGGWVFEGFGSGSLVWLFVGGSV